MPVYLSTSPSAIHGARKQWSEEQEKVVHIEVRVPRVRFFQIRASTGTGEEGLFVFLRLSSWHACNARMQQSRLVSSPRGHSSFRLQRQREKKKEIFPEHCRRSTGTQFFLPLTRGLDPVRRVPAAVLAVFRCGECGKQARRRLYNSRAGSLRSARVVRQSDTWTRYYVPWFRHTQVQTTSLLAHRLSLLSGVYGACDLAAACCGEPEYCRA